MDLYGINIVFVEVVFVLYVIVNSCYIWLFDVLVGWIDGCDISCKYSQIMCFLVVLVVVGVCLCISDESVWYYLLFFSFQFVGINYVIQVFFSYYQFVSMLGLQFKYVSFVICYIFNGGLYDFNSGEMMVLVGVGFDI